MYGPSGYYLHGLSLVYILEWIVCKALQALVLYSLLFVFDELLSSNPFPILTKKLVEDHDVEMLKQKVTIVRNRPMGESVCNRTVSDHVILLLHFPRFLCSPGSWFRVTRAREVWGTWLRNIYRRQITSYSFIDMLMAYVIFSRQR